MLYVSKLNDYLMFDVIAENNHIIGNIVIIALYTNELNLDQGRFRYFSHDQQQYRVSIDYNTNLDGYNDLIEWIAIHASEPWSLCPELFKFGEFSFANATTAVTFALVWK